jgi:hypothetical protein
LACSALLFCASCDITLGPKIERKAIIVVSGVPVEILESRALDCHVLSEKSGEINRFKQDVGGWVAMPPDHWKTLKEEVQRLRKKCGEPEKE